MTLRTDPLILLLRYSLDYLIMSFQGVSTENNIGGLKFFHANLRGGDSWIYNM